jgi:hypothetical protein
MEPAGGLENVMSATTKPLTMTPEYQARAMANICASGKPEDVEQIATVIFDLIRDRDALRLAAKGIVDLLAGDNVKSQNIRASNEFDELTAAISGDLATS